MTTPPRIPDIFEILDIAEREDTYSGLLVHILRRSPELCQQLMAHAFKPAAPPTGPVDVKLRHRFPNERVVDILLRDPADPPRWAVFIESKLYSREHTNQTIEYLKATRALVTPDGRPAGIFLTITGETAKADVPSLTHRELAGWIERLLPSLKDDSALAIAAEAYTLRASAKLPDPASLDARVRDLRRKSVWGLVPHLASAWALGTTLRHGLSTEWLHDAVSIQSRGHSNPGLQFWLPTWRGTEVENDTWTPENIYVHLEVELTESPPWRLKVHFETEPYLTQRRLQEHEGHEGFARMRDAFRNALHAQKAKFPDWKPTHHKLQSAVIAAKLDPDATVAQLRDRFAPAMATIAPCITEALAQARATMKPRASSNP